MCIFLSMDNYILCVLGVYLFKIVISYVRVFFLCFAFVFFAFFQFTRIYYFAPLFASFHFGFISLAAAANSTDSNYFYYYYTKSGPEISHTRTDIQLNAIHS